MRGFPLEHPVDLADIHRRQRMHVIADQQLIEQRRHFHRLHARQGQPAGKRSHVIGAVLPEFVEQA